MIISAIQVQAEPLDDGAGEDEDMPKKVRGFFLYRERYYPERIDNSADKDVIKAGGFDSKQLNGKQQAAPTERDAKYHMYRFYPRGAENAYERHTDDDYRPLRYRKADAERSADDVQQNGEVRSADKKINSCVIKAAKQPFYPATVQEGVI